jgi:hypothetical protein
MPAKKLDVLYGTVQTCGKFAYLGRDGVTMGNKSA